MTVAAQPGPRQEAPIDAIPLAQVEPFLKQLSVVDSIEQLPQVVGLEVGDGAVEFDLAHVAGISGGDRFDRCCVLGEVVPAQVLDSALTAVWTFELLDEVR